MVVAVSEARVPAEAFVDANAHCVTCGAAVGECDCLPNMTDRDLPVVTHTGIVQIGGMRLTCHVLSNGVRVFDADDLREFMPGFFAGGDR